MDELQRVRLKTEADTAEITDEEILSFLADYPERTSKARVLLAAADCLEALARSDRYSSESVGAQSVSGPLLYEKAKDLRRRANLTNPVLA